MEPPIANSALQGRKEVRLRLRRNLVLIPQQERSRPCYVLKDPVSLGYFRLDERQRFLTSLMDGAHTLEQIRAAYERHFRPERLALDELESFAGQLVSSGLVDNSSPLAGRLLFGQTQKRLRRARVARLLNFLNIRVPLFDAGPLLARLAPAGLLFSRTGLLLALTAMGGALGLLATHWDAFVTRLPGYREFFSLGNLVYLWLALGLVKICHEIGHGLCCKRLGGEPREMGLLLLLFFPALYCDVSDSWALPGKWRRMAIGAAGIYVELLIAAMATFGWWASDGGAFVHELCLALMVVCGANTVLVNGNPLMRFDGYFVLADWLEIPNLAELSAGCLRDGFLSWLGVATPPPPVPLPSRQRFWLAGYAVVSFLYRWAVLALTLYVLYTVLRPLRLAALPVLLAAGSVAVLLVWPVGRLLHALHDSGGLRTMKASRVYITLAAVLLAALLVGLVPWPVRVEGTALVQFEADQADRVVVPACGGFMDRLLVRDGQRVRAGEVLAVLSNRRLEIAARVNETDQGLRLEQQRALAAHVAAAREAGARADLARAELELRSLRQQHRILDMERQRLVLRAPRDGVVVGLAAQEDQGKWLPAGTEVCRVGAERALRVVLLLEPSDHVRVASGNPARVRVHGCGSLSWPGVVSEVAQVEARGIPEQLARRAGGEVETDPDPGSRQEAPRRQHYLVSIRLERADRRIHPGALGRVQVSTGSQTLWWRLRRYLATNFNWGL